MELESRVINIIFGWDMHNFINDDSIDEKLEDVMNAISENRIMNMNCNINLKDETISDSDICSEIASYLKEQGNHLIVIETPIPTNIKKDESGFKSWGSGFGYCRITVIMINSFDIIRETIKKVEDNIMEEEYKKELEKIENIKK